MRSELVNEIIQFIIKADKQNELFEQHWNVNTGEAVTLTEWITSLELPKWR